MPELILSIIKEGGQYRAILESVGFGEKPRLAKDKEVVFQCYRFTTSKLEDVREANERLKKEATEWARKNNIPFVENLDSEPHLY